MATFEVFNCDEFLCSTVHISTDPEPVLRDTATIGGPMWSAPHSTSAPVCSCKEFHYSWSDHTSGRLEADSISSCTPFISSRKRRSSEDEPLSMAKLIRLSVELGFEPVDVVDRQDDEKELEVSSNTTSSRSSDDIDEVYTIVDLSVAVDETFESSLCDDDEDISSLLSLLFPDDLDVSAHEEALCFCSSSSMLYTEDINNNLADVPVHSPSQSPTAPSSLLYGDYDPDDVSVLHDETMDVNSLSLEDLPCDSVMEKILANVVIDAIIAERRLEQSSSESTCPVSNASTPTLDIIESIMLDVAITSQQEIVESAVQYENDFLCL